VQYVQGSAGTRSTSTLPRQAPKKRAMVYDERTNELVEVQPQVETIPAEAPQQQLAQAAPSASASGANPIVILNNQNARLGSTQAQNATQVQELPTAVIEDTPIKASNAERMRKKRQETEAGTEDGIVQALERARMDDEVRRRDRFNNAITASPAAQEPVAQPTAPAYPNYQPTYPPPVAQPAPVVQQVAPAPVVIAPVIEREREENEKVDIKSEIREALKENQPKAKDPQQYYVGALIGLADYSSTINVHGNLSSGVTIGMITPDRFVFEGNFLYSTFQMDDVHDFTHRVQLKQYNFGGTVKYQLLPGRIRPTIGAVGTYTRRGFNEFGYEFRTSNAFDVGVAGGLDIMISDSFSLGVDVRYMTTLVHRDSNSYNDLVRYQPWGEKNIEDIDYYTAAVVGKFTF
jgi:hypothetical protein